MSMMSIEILQYLNIYLVFVTQKFYTKYEVPYKDPQTVPTPRQLSRDFEDRKHRIEEYPLTFFSLHDFISLFSFWFWLSWVSIRTSR